MRTARRIVLAMLTAIVSIGILAGCKKTRNFDLNNFDDYLARSAVMYKSGGYRNVKILSDFTDYKIALKELRQLFGKEVDSSSRLGTAPGDKRAMLGIYEDKDSSGKSEVILQVGAAIIKGGKHWNWIVSDARFDDGEYILKRSMSDKEYNRLRK
jgi:hypothetical protein